MFFLFVCFRATPGSVQGLFFGILFRGHSWKTWLTIDGARNLNLGWPCIRHKYLSTCISTNLLSLWPLKFMTFKQTSSKGAL